MKKFVKCLMLVLVLPLAMMCTACDKAIVSIKDIKLTNRTGIVDEYTITYTNGKTDKFTITNGEDGENLYSNITINDLFNQVKDSKPADYDILDFIDEYLDIQIDTNAIASAKALRSAVSIFVEHPTTIPDYNNITGYTQTIYGIQVNYGSKASINVGAGAGVIYQLDTQSGDAYIITNYHVCFSSDSESVDKIATRFVCYAYGAETLDYNDIYYLNLYNEDNKTYADKFKYDAEGKPIIDYGYGAIEAEYIGGAEKYDIAVLKVTGSNRLKDSDYLAIDTYNSDDVVAGSRAIAVGNPEAAGLAVTSGVISVDSEYIQLTIENEVVLREFRIDTSVNPGNSGGGLFDSLGRFIGIVNAKDATGKYENMGYAIPGNIATRVADSIIDNCDGVARKTKKVLIGITPETIDSKSTYQADLGCMKTIEVIAISEVESNSLASDMQLKAGDIINYVKIVKENTTITITIDRIFKLTDAMLLVREGDSVIFNYTRGEITTNASTGILVAENFNQVS